MIYEYTKIGIHHSVTYKDFSDVRKPREVSEESRANLLQNNKGKKYNGYMSKETARRVKEYINVFVQVLYYGSKQRRKPTFVTLTLPSRQMHSDNEIKRHMLNDFIKNMKRKTDTKYNVWRAEPQGNGNIHFHLLMDTYIDWKLIRGHWNRILNRHKYIDEYRKNMNTFHKEGFQVREDLLRVWTLEKQKKAYEYGIKTNWSNPNTTDIHALQRVKSIGSYITKYMCKSDANGRAITGRIWGASKEIKGLKYYKETLAIHDFDNTATNYDMTDYLTELENEQNTEVKGNDYFEVYIHRQSSDELLKKHSKTIYARYKDYYVQLYSQMY